jgi:transmembrane sensor
MNDLTRLEAAADWLIRLNDAPGDEALIAAWLQWCDEDRDNLPAFKRTQAVWQAAALMQEPRRTVRTTLKPWFAMAATVVLGGAATLAWFSARHSLDSGQQSYSTPIAGRGQSVLPDGSKVDLGAGSRITTQYSDTTRGVTVDSGEAFFSVKKDARRPFVVTAGNLRVIAVGTAFDVRRAGDQVVVAVEEGKVRVSDTAGSGPDLAAVGAGEQAVYREKVRSLALGQIKLADAASWRDGILKYEHEPLSVVVADLNRYSTRKIVIGDPSIASLPFTGTVFSTRIDDALHAFSDVFPVTLIEHADSIELDRR